MPKYSIIVPVYNCEKELPSCVESILRQTLPDFELLLIDDGSPDRSGALCEALARKDDRIRVFHKRNGGAASARNYGIEQARGDYLVFIDGDDTITENCLETLDPAVSPKTVVIFGIRFDYYSKSRLVRSEDLSCRFAGEHTLDALAAAFPAFFRDNQLSSACNKVICRSAVESCRLRFREEMNLYEDFEFVLRLLPTAETVSCVGLPLYEYRISLKKEPYLNSRTVDLGRIRSNYAILARSVLDFYAKHPQPAVLSTAADLYLLLLHQHLMQRKRCKPRELAGELTDYCADPSFRAITEAGGTLSGTQAELRRMIEEGAFSRIVRAYRVKRIKARIRAML